MSPISMWETENMVGYDPRIASTVMLIIFLVLIVVGALAIVSALYNRLYPFISKYVNSDRIAQWRARLSFRPVGRTDDEDDGDEMDFETMRLLANIPMISVVLGEDDDVLRASPAAYRLGVVDDDRVISPDIAEAAREVRRDGGSRSLKVVTHTPDRFRGIELPSDDGNDDIMADDHASGESVSRPNWLNVTVGKFSSTKIVILIDDVSEEKRFAQTRDSFVRNVTEQLLKPTRLLEELGENLSRDDVDIDRIIVEAGQVHEYAARMRHLVEDLLLLIKAQTRIEPGDDNIIDLMEQIRLASDALTPMAEDRGVRLTVRGDDTLMVHGDAEQLRGAFAKLIENAIDYSPGNAPVGIVATRDKDGRHAIVRVVDQGCGIPKDEQPRIFERFYRGADQHGRTTHGVGLGLAIVKHVALTHRGSVSVWSAPHKGSTFTMLLPLA